MSQRRLLRTPPVLSLGVCVLTDPRPNAPRVVQQAAYIHEILGHAGVAYRVCNPGAITRHLDYGLRILITVGESPIEPEEAHRLADWVRDGGVWISVGGLCAQEALFGAAYAPSTFTLWGGTLRNLGEGYLAPPFGATPHPILHDVRRPMHFYGGIAVQAREATAICGTQDAHGRPSPFPAVLEHRLGSGRCILIAPDITGTVVHIQQGVTVTRDGVSAPDGTAPVTDGVLKSDDGQVLDWLLDRDPVPGVPGLSAFLEPIADCWRDLLLRTIFYAATAHDVIMPLLWYWPQGQTAIGHLSHDTDGNHDALALRLLDTLAQADVKSTWCVILPGYGLSTMAAIRDAGHEFATHFNALDDGCPWNEELFREQWCDLCDLFGPENKPVTNKNHYLRWQGEVELWEWCARLGIRIDQSKGASKTGEAGFNFGTCHPYRPARADGSVIDIHELATPTQDLHIFSPEELREPLLECVIRHYGVLHLLFHPIHIAKPEVAESILRSVRAGKDRGISWWTARQIVHWEEARRTVRWNMDESLSTTEALSGATILYLAPTDVLLARDDEPLEADPVERWGFRFRSVSIDLAAGESARFSFLRGVDV